MGNASSRGGSSHREPAGADAAASFERLCAMYADVAALQSAMGVELQKLSQSLNRGRAGGPVAAAASRVRVSPRIAPHTAPADVTKKRLSLAKINEGEEQDEERTLFASARRFLPPWAQPSELTALNA